LGEFQNAINFLQRYCLDGKGEDENFADENVSHEGGEGTDHVLHYKYLLAVCYRGKKMFKLAQKIYLDYYGSITESSNREIGVTLFAFLLYKSSIMNPRRMCELTCNLYRLYKLNFKDRELYSLKKFWNCETKRWD
jgi:hypothetical protein